MLILSILKINDLNDLKKKMIIIDMKGEMSLEGGRALMGIFLSFRHITLILQFISNFKNK